MNRPLASPRFILLLGVLIALPALGTDMYLPALPALARALQADANAAQATLTTYFIGLALGQLLWGPLSDRYGRKPVLYTGLLVTLGASILAAFADSVGAIAALRLAQGLGMSSGQLIGRTIVRDLYAHEQAAKLLASMTIVFSLVPMLAPIAGAVFTRAAGWPAVFAAMAVIVALLLASIRSIAETAPAERRSAHPGAIARTFWALLADRRFLSPFLVIVSAQCAILAWVSNSALTLVRGFGMSAVAYAFMFAFVMLGQSIGAWASSRLVVRLGIARLLRAGAFLMFGAGAAAALLAWAGVQHWLAVIVPFMLVLFGSALIVPNATAAALTPFPGSAGAASSLIGALGFAAGAVISTVLGALFDGTARPMALAGALAGVGAFFSERGLRGKA